MAVREREGIDFEVEVVHRDPSCAVFAIHGGGIEPTTDVIAAEVARLGGFGFYALRGIRESGNRSLHVSSAGFDDPRAIALASASRVAVSIHGCTGDEELAHLGGSNAQLASEIARTLRLEGIAVQSPSARFPGRSPANIVNRAILGGAQLELTRSLRDRLSADSAWRARICLALLGAVREIAKQP